MVTKKTANKAAPTAGAAAIIYYVLWRTRPTHPWHSEELFNRIDAHNKYFSLLQRGYEAYVEKRKRALLPA